MIECDVLKVFRPWNPTQSFLLPPSPLEWLPEGHLALIVIDFFDAANMSAIEDAIDLKDPRGNPPFNPRMMAALLFYGYCIGVPSSRKIEGATYTDVAFRVIAAGLHPDHSVISEFRRAHREALEQLYLTVLKLCQKAGLVKLGHVSLDGTKVQANASKHKAMSFDRMQKTEAELMRQIEELLTGAEQADKKDDEQHGPGKRGDEIPEELRRREKRLQTIREAKAALLADAAATRAEEVAAQAERARQKVMEAASAEQAAKAQRAAERAEERAKEAAARAKTRADERVRAAQEAAKKAAEKAAEKAATLSEKRASRRAQLAQEAAERDRDTMNRRLDGNADPLPAHRVPSDKDGNPTPSAQRNFTDPDSRIMKSGTGDYVQGYNCQASVDSANQIIVAQGVTNQAPDAEHFPPMLDAAESNVGTPEVMTADAGYWSEANAAHAEAAGVDAYINVARDKHGLAAVEAAPTPSASAEGFATQVADSPARADQTQDAIQVASRTVDEADARARMRAKVTSPEGKAIYRLRKTLPEPVFGQIKEVRGFRRFLLRGIQGARCEWSLITTTHNFLKLVRGLRRQGSTLRELMAAG